MIMHEMTSDELLQHVRDHRWHHRATVETVTAAARRGRAATVRVPTFVNEFWTSRQRAAHSLHEISYRACFKPQLPRFFIDRLTEPGAVVYDPFAGRGTTPLEAALAGRVPVACDINPLSADAARAAAGAADASTTCVRAWTSIDLDRRGAGAARPARCSTIPTTLSEIAALRHYLLDRERARRARRRRPLDPDGGRQPPDRPFARLLLGLHAAAEPGDLGAEPAEDQRGARAGAAAARRARDRAEEVACAAEGPRPRRRARTWRRRRRGRGC